ncbi:hypothetical protein RRG08_039449 [Elysia crispata]|uniref:Integrase catalytic domain-containing protein n=1 Tax=Elysia crispata TaxID=231223 RepID=A0AAE1AAR7_9GAST|nr:hypothetical protein RRG08_039449 [Elysia crispata]
MGGNNTVRSDNRQRSGRGTVPCLPVDVPREIQSCREQQFMSSPLCELDKMPIIKHYFPSLYHPQSNGIVGRFHSTIRTCLKVLATILLPIGTVICLLFWLRIINKYVLLPDLWRLSDLTVLFPPIWSQRVMLSKDTGFSHFFLRFGQAARGPMENLSEIFTNKNLSVETASQYHLVVDLYNRIRSACKSTQENARNSASNSMDMHEPR